MNALEELSDSFSRLPGIGKKTALRLAYFCLKADKNYLQHFAQELETLHEKIKKCSICGCYTEKDPCEICTNPQRDQTLICVVEQPQDVQVIDSSHEFKGLFHVLGGVIAPLDGIGPDKLAVTPLLERVKNGVVHEVILATNPTVEGDTTALYLHRLLSQSGVKISRLASGIPVGGDLEYADKLTLARSFRGRQIL